LSKGGEVGEVKVVTGADRTLDLRVRSVVQQWRSFGLRLDAGAKW
jgi:hypothetical protein